MRILPTAILALSFVFTGAACGDDSSSSSSNKPKARANSKRKAKAATVVKGEFSTYPKVAMDLRHNLQEGDFVPDVTGKTNRDPFRSWALTISDDVVTEVIEVVDVCQEKGNGVEWEARNYSIRDLELIGIVRRGRSFAQFTDKGGTDSWIVRKGDCLGQEKAIIEEITVKVIRLVITPPTPPGRPAPPSQYQNISLYPEEREIDSSIINSRTRDLR
ncbi:MAG: hypothetical protein JKY56_17260 [Kofleriaceae bacterium]|nr:hypothetical protein [Kofleriaceae bacterium]